MIKSKQDIFQIYKLLAPTAHKFDIDSINIVDTIPSYYLLKLDEEMWSEFRPNEKYLLTKVENDEIIINRGRVNFRLKGDGDYGYPVKEDEYGKKYIQENKKTT